MDAYLRLITIALVLTLVSCGTSRSEEPQVGDDDAWTFVSMPDFLNVDTDYPQPGWEDELSYVLESVKAENPDFLVVPGDLVMGHWDGPDFSDADTISKYAARYYSAWKERMDAHGLTYYTSIGDHEIGDDPWREPKKLAAVGVYKDAFAQHMDMPRNGPAHMQGTAFWWRHKNVLFVSVDVFEEGEGERGGIKAGVTGEQLAWLRQVLADNADVDYRVVMGHTPVLGPVRRWSSSGLMLEEGRESGFWRTLKEYDVDLYLCGEVHAITCTEDEGLVQVAHGGLIGYNSRTNYMVVEVSDAGLQLTIKEIDILPEGEPLWQMGENRPVERVVISDADRARGFYVSGTARIDREDGVIERRGYFLPELQRSSERAKPYFLGEGNGKVPREMSRVVVE